MSAARMRLNQLVEVFNDLDFPTLSEAEDPERAAVLQARAAVEAAVADDDFLLDCMALELRLIAAAGPRLGLVPFLTLPRTGIRFALGYWPPGGGPGAHEHTAWTITGVLRNELEVRTFDRAASYRTGTLVDKNVFSAPAGKVGYIYEPGIHAPRNPSAAWSLSLHVISPRDGRPLADQVDMPAALRSDPGPPEYPNGYPYESVVMARQRQRWVRELASIAAASASPLRRPLLESCFELGSSMTREHVNRLAPGQFDPGASRAQSFVLRRIHSDVVLRLRVTPEGPALAVQTRTGLVDELVINELAREALAHAVAHLEFDVHALPGDLDSDERVAVGEALEETGLFARVSA
jgi:hypothetical protein